MIVRWRIWYDDGKTFSSDDGSPEDAPPDGILGIREWYDDGTTRRLPFEEYYEWTGDGWRAGDRADLEKWLRQTYPALKFGRWAPHGVWTRIRSAIMQKEF